MRQTVKIAETTGQWAITVDDAEEIVTKVLDWANVELDFDGVAAIAAPFCVALVGDRFRFFEEDGVTILNLLPEIKKVLARVVKNNREYFTNANVRAAVDRLYATSDDEDV